MNQRFTRNLKFCFSGRGARVECFDIHVSKAVGIVSNLIQELEAEAAQAAQAAEATQTVDAAQAA